MKRDLLERRVAAQESNRPVVLARNLSGDGEFLLDGGADPNLADRGGITPMRHARQRGFHGIGALLFKARGH